MEIIKIGYVYMITSPSGRIYIGSTSQEINKRWIKYKNLDCKSQSKLYRSLLKYTYDSHIFEIIWSGDVKEIKKKECILGHFYNVLDRNLGMNLKLPDLHEFLSCMSDETKEKMSKSRMGRIVSEETRQKLRLANKDKIPSDASREASRNRVITDKYREHMRDKSKGNNSRGIKIICTKTSTIFPSAVEASKTTLFTSSYLSRMLRGDRKNKTTFKYYET